MNNKFEPNKKYFTISVYVILVITISTIIISLIINQTDTQAFFSKIITILQPFFAGCLIAYLVNPFVKSIDRSILEKLFRLRNQKVRKALSILFAYLFVIGFIVICFRFILPQIITSISDLVNRIPELYKFIYDFMDQIEDTYPQIDFKVINDSVNSALPQIANYVKDALTNIILNLYTTSISLIRGLINILLSVVISCYLIIDKGNLRQAILRILYAFIKKERVDSFVKTLGECDTIFINYMVGKALDSLIIGIMCFVLMAILKIPFVVLISVFVGITNMIPYFGPFIGAIPGVLILLYFNPVKALVFAIMIFALQQFDGLYLGPKILGKSTGIKPLWIIFAITVGGGFFGILGMFVGVPVVAVISHILDKSVEKRLERKGQKDTTIQKNIETN